MKVLYLSRFYENDYNTYIDRWSLTIGTVEFENFDLEHKLPIIVYSGLHVIWIGAFTSTYVPFCDMWHVQCCMIGWEEVGQLTMAISNLEVKVIVDREVLF